MNFRKIQVLACAFVSAFVPLSASAFDAKIDTEKTFQKMDNFAASDAWSGAFIGKYFDDRQRAQAAKWLFSQKIGADGNPEGIGLSMWRFNLGGGTLEQSNADILPRQRRAESFLSADGENFDWGKCSGQMYFAKKAREYGVEKLLLFSNTPPVQYTRNGRGYGMKGDYTANLKSDCYAKFADYMAAVAEKFAVLGFKVDYISPVNEPQGNWNTNAQEGTPWTCSEMKRLSVELDRALEARGLDTLIYIGETAHPYYNYDYAYGDYDKKRWSAIPEDERPFDVVAKFFAPQSKFYIGNLKHMAKFISGHSYYAHTRNADMEKIHGRIAETARKYGVGYQQSEWCLLPKFKAKDMDGFSPDWFSDNRADIQTALLMGRIIYSDLVNANSLAWGYWKAFEINGNHSLLGAYPKDGSLENGGVVRANKLLWGLGNFSLFVRPNYLRCRIDGACDLSKTAAVAFVSPDGKRVVAVFVNSSFEDDVARISLPKKFAKAKLRVFKTDANSDLANQRAAENSRSVPIGARSITTAVFDIE